MKQITLIILFLFTGLSYIYSQPSLQWVATYRGPGNWIDSPHQLLPVGGDIYITGSSFGAGTFADYCTIKYNDAGIEQWVQRYNGPESFNDYARLIHNCRAGGFFVLGRTSTEQFSTSRIVKYSESGIQEWVKEYTNLTYWCGAVDSSDNIIICGLVGMSPDINFKTVKFDTSGNEIWTKLYTGVKNFNDEPLAAGVDLLGNIFVTGYTSSGEYSRNRDILTLKYLPDGSLGWTRIYNASANDFDAAYNISIDHNNAVYVSGWSNRGFNNDQDMISIKYDNAGNQVWVNRYNGAGNYTDCARASVVDSQNNFYVAGYIYNNNVTGTDFCTIKYSSEGQLAWIKTFAGYGAGIDGADAITLDNFSNVYVTGSSWGKVTNYDIATIKYDPVGNEIWSVRYSSLGNYEDQPSDIKVDNSGNVYITGEGSYRMFTTLKYSQSTGISPVSTLIPKKFSLSQNYPNPFNPVTNIKFDIPLSRGVSEGRGVFVKLLVYDLLGREITLLINQQMQPGTYSVDWDATNYPSGVYFYSLVVGDNTNNVGYRETKKMVLLK